MEPINWKEHLVASAIFVSAVVAFFLFVGWLLTFFGITDNVFLVVEVFAFLFIVSFVLAMMGEAVASVWERISKG